MEVAKVHQEQLERLKKRIKHSYEYFKPNYDRFNEFREFVFDSSLTADDISLLASQARPQLEFNVLEAYISRLLGEFSKQEPDIMVSADDPERADPIMIKVIEQHLRHVITDQKSVNTRYEVYKDLLSGGFSALKMSTDYDNPMSMHQVIKIDRVFDPTLCGFDTMAHLPHKGDGRFCFELFPMSEDEFKDQYPHINTDDLSYRKDLAGFNWSYLNANVPTLIVGDFYEKRSKEERIMMLSNNQVVTVKKYKDMEANWNYFEQIPKPVGKIRKTQIETIHRYRIIENKVLEHVETDFAHLPLIFVDGNSIVIKRHKNGSVSQVTRPYVYHAKGAQKLKNYAGISLANEIENIVQHKFMVAKEALPKEEDFLQAYKDVQKASVLVYNSVHEDNPEQPIANPIREVAKVSAPPEIVQTFTGADSLIQNVLGSYDASLGINNNQLSGIAIVEAASQSNATAMPYIVGFLQGYQRAAEIYVDLMPKYFTTPRSLPIMDEEGHRSYIKINQENGLPMSFETNMFNVVVKAGASFQVQKSRTIMMVKEMMGMSPLFQQFIAEKGLGFVLDNMEGRGIEQLKKMVEAWTQELEKQKQMAQQQQQQEMQNNPLMMNNRIEMAKVQMKGQEMQMKAQEQQQRFALDLAKLRQDEAKIMADLQQSKESQMVQVLKAETERFSKSIDLAMKKQDQHHRHLKESIETIHKTSQPEHKEMH